jgi:ribonucleoside-diphosphate reductase alpha chain
MLDYEVTTTVRDKAKELINSPDAKSDYDIAAIRTPLRPIFGSMDPAQCEFGLFDSPISSFVWDLKYKRELEVSIQETIIRVVKGVMGDINRDNHIAEIAYSAIYNGVFLPGGRILAGAGLEHHDSTLMNCYVMGDLGDSLDEILTCFNESTITQKYGGGIGINFSRLRPKGAKIVTAAYLAGGPVAFMGIWEAMGHAIEAGGNRRGGKMAILNDSHPDILDFITAKQEAGKLTSFNISVGVSNKFMDAVNANDQWKLVHKAPRGDLPEEDQEAIFVDGEWVYVWGTIPARDLWDRIMQCTYDNSEPGVIFLDEVNKGNPINYLERISATNPCGEQPLPPYGACNLGAVNLARIVRNPFSDKAFIDWELLNAAVTVGVRFLDNVLDVTKYPLAAMQEEATTKRRIGLGITGLGDMLCMLDIPYGSQAGNEVTSWVMRRIANQAYLTSSVLAEEKGVFKRYDSTKHVMHEFPLKLDKDVYDRIVGNGLRNSVILTIAPTGTTSVVFGDVSSGCEPVFAHTQERKIKVKNEKNDDTWQTVDTYSFPVRMYAQQYACSPKDAIKALRKRAGYATSETISPIAHVGVQAALQRWVDASISKTINVPQDTPFDALKEVYMHAYDMGAKGCTTYRPSENRGAVLISKDNDDTNDDDINYDGGNGGQEECNYEHALAEVDFGKVEERALAHLYGEKQVAAQSTSAKLQPQSDFQRSNLLHGVTHKVDWPGLAAPVFVTVNHDADGNPVEIFITSKNAQYNEWTTALSVMMSKLLQVGLSGEEVASHLKDIILSQSSAWINGKHYGSLISYIAELLSHHVNFAMPMYLYQPDAITDDGQMVDLKTANEVRESILKDACTFCGSYNTRKESGCLKCDDCGQSKCD